MPSRPIALITGGAGGLGRACAARLRSTHQLVLADTALAKAQDAAAEFGALPLECNVESETSVAACIQAVESSLGPVDALVTMAGIIQERHFSPEAFTQGDWDRVMGINAKGTWICCRLVGAGMAARGRGSIVTVSSIAGHGSWSTHAYGPSKAAVMNITQNLAAEWGRSGVRVNSVSPGFTKTERMEELERSRGTDNQKLIRQSALGRWIRPGEVASAIAFLLSDEASAITGVDLPVDAGWLCGVRWSGSSAGEVPPAR